MTRFGTNGGFPIITPSKSNPTLIIFPFAAILIKILYFNTKELAFMSSDLIYIIWWWFIFFLFGLVSIPLTWLFFRRFIDLGYGFSKTIGLIIVAYFIFLTGISHILPFTKTWLYVVFLSYTTVNYYIFKIKRKEIVSDVLKNIRVLIAQEILFIIGLLFWSYVRAHNPEIRGLEKLIDFGFINSILRSKYLPPTDMWFAGLSINYYWFGHF